MRFLIIGLGSMGKRRVRNLKALGHTDITGFDIKSERTKETENNYGIKILNDLNNLAGFDAVIISTPPDRHNEYIKRVIKAKKPCFVELSIIGRGLEEFNQLAKSQGVLIAPSCTFRFHPAIKQIKEIVQGGIYGKVTNFTYHSGQYLPDWHPWEKVNDFFVGKKETSGCRELLSFELHWMIDVLGAPKELFAYREKSLDFNNDLKDTYAIGLKFNNFLGLLLIDVVSRFATRALILNLEKAQIRWNREEALVKIYDAQKRKWLSPREPEGKAGIEHNKNIIEKMYLDEIETFIKAFSRQKEFPNTLNSTIEILKILEACEETNKGVTLK